MGGGSVLAASFHWKGWLRLSGKDAIVKHFATKKVFTALPNATQAVLRLMA
jgi:hypothetical protein